MQEIERALNDNLGNRLTRELVIGLYSMISHHVNAIVAEAVKVATDNKDLVQESTHE